MRVGGAGKIRRDVAPLRVRGGGRLVLVAGLGTLVVICLGLAASPPDRPGPADGAADRVADRRQIPAIFTPRDHAATPATGAATPVAPRRPAPDDSA